MFFYTLYCRPAPKLLHTNSKLLIVVKSKLFLASITFAIGWFSLFMVEVAESASEESVGMTVGFALTLNQIAIIFAPALFGYIVDGKGYTYAWMGIAALLSVSAVSLCKSKRILKM
ncbi:hypothetical protein JFU20_25220 [Bacillus sp. TH30]|nr:hypothetical protein [Bacillus sp. TH30]